MPRKSCKRQARARNAKIARRALHPLDARPPVAESGHVNTGTSQYSSREDLQVDPELASFCQRFNLEPRVQDFEDEDRDDAHDPGNSESDRDPSDGPEIFGQSELDHFSAVLRHAQQIAIELEKENERSRKRKTPRHYTGDSLKTSYRRKKAKTQLAEKGFLGVFEYLDLQKQTRATSITAASVTEASVPAANATGASAAAANATTATATAASPSTASATAASLSTTAASTVAANTITATATAASPSTASATAANLSAMAASTAPASVMAARATTTNATASSAMAMSTTALATNATAPNTTITTVSAATATGAAATVVIAPNVPTAFDAGPGTSDMVTDAETVVAEAGVESHPNGPQQDDQASKTVRVLTPRTAWADNGDALVQGAGNDTSPETVERSVETLPDEEEVSDNGSRDEENPTGIREEARRAVDAMLEDLCQRRNEMATGATPGDPLSTADRDLDLWNDRATLHAVR
ncbi:hypothetical protein EDB85DRAFT_1897458 [Lactarius pseudohatsudake]|nr:hypothetical protein EDB85DRAFT_1897458 [Lactarius pseudohatsudake]